MTLSAALWAGSTALTGKAAFAFWTAALLFQCLDRRKSAIVWQILLTISTVLGCVFSSLYSTGNVTLALWVGSAAIAAFSAVKCIRQWTKTSPAEVYEEASHIDSSIKKKAGAKATGSPALKNQAAVSLPWVGLLGLALVAAAVSIPTHALSSSVKSSAWLSAIHILAACVMWGVGIFCAIELTFGSAPKSLSAVSWSGAAIVALACWIAECCIAAAIVLSPIDSDADFQSVAMTRLFAISILLMDFVVWMIPHRVATFKRTGKATAWVSLTMAAWIGVISLAVLCALPSNWPWQHL